MGMPSPQLNRGNRMSMQNDFLSANSKFSILGQEQIPTTPSNVRSIEGMDVGVKFITGSYTTSDASTSPPYYYLKT